MCSAIIYFIMKPASKYPNMSAIIIVTILKLARDVIHGVINTSAPLTTTQIPEYSIFIG